MLSGSVLIPSHPAQAVVLLHGYGSNAEDLMALGQELAISLPQTAFFAPNAPHVIGTDSYEWFSLNDFQCAAMVIPDYLETLNQRASEAVPQVIEYINHLSQTYHISPENFIIGGFSQGGLMALKTAFALDSAVNGVIGMSAVPPAHAQETTKRLSILLTHGGCDSVIPLEGMEQTQRILNEMNQSVETYISPYMAHGIDAPCVQKIRAFIQMRNNVISEDESSLLAC